ncbi:hypothetical protein ACHAP5_010825 [Fusarium lateritium]
MAPTILKFDRKRWRERWRERRRSNNAPRRALDGDGEAQRLRGSPLELKPSLVKKRHPYSSTIRDLPNTPIVKSLIIRFRFRRGVAVKSLAKLCRESFVALESLQIGSCIARTEEQETALLNGLKILNPNLHRRVSLTIKFRS